MAHFLECDTKCNTFFRVVEESAYFGFRCRRDNISENSDESKDCAIVERAACGSQVEVACRSTSGFRFTQVGGIAMNLQDHVRRMVSSNRIGMSCAIVQEVLDKGCRLLCRTSLLRADGIQCC